jgi:rhodanese-related sulfurtransferase
MDALFNVYVLGSIWIISGLWLASIYWQERGQAFVTPAQSIDFINKHNAVIIDVRSVDSYKQVKIVNAKHIALDRLDEKNPNLPNKKRPVILVGDQVADTRKAFNFFLHAKYESVAVLAGGIDAWQSSGFPVVKQKN